MQLTNDQKNIIVSQCVGMLSYTSFSSGIIFSYAESLGLNNASILQLLVLPELASSLILMPAAYYCTKWNIKKLGGFGIILNIIGYLFLIAASFSEKASLPFAYAGASIFGIGLAFYNCGWLVLMGPLIDKNIRGRFLGAMRFSWQLAAILFSYLTMSLIKQMGASPNTYRLILVLIIILQVIRLYTYKKIPDLTKKNESFGNFWTDISIIIKSQNFMSFCCYIFFLTLFTAAAPSIVNLAERENLNFTENNVIFVNSMLFLGNLFGFYFGGSFIDKYGSKTVFILTHFGYGLVLGLFVMRDVFKMYLFIDYLVSHAILLFIFGVIASASSIAITSELYEVINPKLATMSSSFNNIMGSFSRFLSSFACSQALTYNILNKDWQIAGFNLHSYDTILIVFSSMIILLVMTLGLIPSIQKSNNASLNLSNKL